VERNTTVPTEKKETFSTAADNQTAVTVRVFQGERPMASDNRLLDQFNLEGIPPAPRGVPQIQVTFNIDANGILNVSAKDMGTGKEHNVQIQQSSGISDEEIQRMQKDAQSHAEEDQRRRKLAEARNQASSRVYEVEKMMKEHADKLDAGSKSAIEAAIKKVNEKAAADDAAAIESAVDELMKASHAFAQHIYSRGDQAPGGGGETAGAGAAAGGGAKDDVIDAEFEKKD
ncbi:MAG TPA: Hsp70 family protein, partial [Planctomycetaceae bacterium]|nr:Hsp70 family protein [Planctomycetaceae bacterium]